LPFFDSNSQRTFITQESKILLDVDWCKVVGISRNRLVSPPINSVAVEGRFAAISPQVVALEAPPAATGNDLDPFHPAL